MKKNLEEKKYNTNGLLNGMIGALAGGLVGSVVMLLFAPQSGKQTRMLIRNKSIQLRDRTTEGIKKTVAKVQSGTNKITADVKAKAGELKQLGQEKLVEQLDRVSASLDAGKSSIESA